MHRRRLARGGGGLIITVPNETGLHGLVKLMGRRALRRTTDNEFFEQCEAGVYIRRLLRNGYLDDFRDPTRSAYGSHLGFDYRRLFEFINQRYVEQGALVEVARTSSGLGLNKVAVYKKAL